MLKAKTPPRDTTKLIALIALSKFGIVIKDIFEIATSNLMFGRFLENSAIDSLINSNRGRWPYSRFAISIILFDESIPKT